MYVGFSDVTTRWKAFWAEGTAEAQMWRPSQKVSF